MLKKFFFSTFLMGSFLMANPEGPKVVAGEAIFEDGNFFKITAKNGTIIEWDQFSIDVEEVVQIVLPTSEDVVLNRVLEGSSYMLGQLECNGRMIWINPNGILIGENGRVNAEAFIASTLDGDLEIFLEKNGERETSWGLIVNEGGIEAKEVRLVGFEVQNHGIIEADSASLIGMRGEPTDEYVNTWAAEDDLFWPKVRAMDGANALNMPGPTVTLTGEIHGNRVSLSGDYLDCQGWIDGKKVLLEGTAIVKLLGLIDGPIELMGCGYLINRAKINGHLSNNVPHD